jgi:O-antigen/teichoic acid export membrane protein
MLGVAAFGSLEFAIVVVTWFLLIGDGGLEAWAVREGAKGSDPGGLAGRVISLRLLLATGALILLFTALPFLPAYPSLKKMLLILAACLPLQAVNLKWAFMGRLQMGRVAGGLLSGQIVFAGLAVALVRKPSDLVLVALLRFLGDFVTTLWFGMLYLKEYGSGKLQLTWLGSTALLRSAFILGATNALAVASFNFDSLLLGFLGSVEDVGLYGAAYKLIVIALALPVAYFLGLYPTLARSWAIGAESLRLTVNRSLALVAAFAIPVGITGVVFADEMLGFLFGSAYLGAATTLRILVVSSVLVMLRGTLRQGFLATENVRIDLSCAASATALNVILNFILIPLHGIVGAAVATLTSEVLWFGTAATRFKRRVSPVSILSHLRAPLISGVVMSSLLVLFVELAWPLRALSGIFGYLVVMLSLTKMASLRWFG